jgi:hypothetical protein
LQQHPEGPAYDALQLLGEETSIPQMATESWDTYALRLQDPWETWSYAGTEQCLEEQLTLSVFSDAQVMRYYGNGSDSEFIVYFPVGSHPVTSAGPTYGTPGLVYGDIYKYGPVGLEQSQILSLKTLVRHWKPATWKCPYAVFQISGNAYGETGLVYGAPGLVYGGEQARTEIQWGGHEQGYVPPPIPVTDGLIGAWDASKTTGSGAGLVFVDQSENGRDAVVLDGAPDVSQNYLGSSGKMAVFSNDGTQSLVVDYSDSTVVDMTLYIIEYHSALDAGQGHLITSGSTLYNGPDGYRYQRGSGGYLINDDSFNISLSAVKNAITRHHQQTVNPDTSWYGENATASVGPINANTSTEVAFDYLYFGRATSGSSSGFKVALMYDRYIEHGSDDDLAIRAYLAENAGFET